MGFWTDFFAMDPPWGWRCGGCGKFEESYSRPNWVRKVNLFTGPELHHDVWEPNVKDGYDYGHYTYCGHVRRGRKKSD